MHLASLIWYNVLKLPHVVAYIIILFFYMPGNFFQGISWKKKNAKYPSTETFAILAKENETIFSIEIWLDKLILTY